MKASIIKIGNSRGIRLPKPIIEQCGLEKEVELEVRRNEIVIRPLRKPRQGWAEKFKTMAEQGNDKLIEFPLTEWEEDEWEWT